LIKEGLIVRKWNLREHPPEYYNRIYGRSKRKPNPEHRPTFAEKSRPHSHLMKEKNRHILFPTKLNEKLYGNRSKVWETVTQTVSGFLRKSEPPKPVN